MTKSDEVRRYVFHNYVEPARRRGDATVTVRAGDVHRAMGLSRRLPLVCSAIGARWFEDEYRVHLVSREGPEQGANVYFTFEV